VPYVNARPITTLRCGWHTSLADNNEGEKS
jgi:hypothetical protein